MLTALLAALGNVSPVGGSFLSTQHRWAHICSTVSNSAPPSRRETLSSWRVHRRANKEIEELEHISYERKLRELGLFSLRKADAQGRSYRCRHKAEGRAQRRQSQTLFCSAQWQDKRKWAQTGAQEVQSEYEEKTKQNKTNFTESVILWSSREELAWTDFCTLSLSPCAFQSKEEETR